MAEASGAVSPPVEQIMQIMSMVDVSDQEPYAAMSRLGLQTIQTITDN